jgi:hypothetical protein
VVDNHDVVVPLLTVTYIAPLASAVVDADVRVTPPLTMLIVTVSPAPKPYPWTSVLIEPELLAELVHV